MQAKAERPASTRQVLRRPGPLQMNINAIAAAVFLPLLYWTGAVIAISRLGYPGVVWMTPLAWLLALPAGFRLARQSSSPMPTLLLEGAAAGGLLGACQGLLVAVGLLLGGAPAAAAPPGLAFSISNVWLAAGGALLAGAPACAGLAALAAWWGRRRLGA